MVFGRSMDDGCLPSFWVGGVGCELLMVLVREDTKSRRSDSWISLFLSFILLSLISNIRGKEGKGEEKKKGGI